MRNLPQYVLVFLASTGTHLALHLAVALPIFLILFFVAGRDRNQSFFLSLIVSAVLWQFLDSAAGKRLSKNFRNRRKKQ